MSDSPKTTPLEWCPAMADAVHAWSIPDSKGVSECLWCYERRSADGQSVSPAKVTRADSEQPERKSTPTPRTDAAKWKTPLGDFVINSYVCEGIESDLAATASRESALRAERDRLRAALGESKEWAESTGRDKLAAKIEETLAGSGSGWMDIESAPKDGTPILACNLQYYRDHGHLPVVVRFKTYHPNAKGDKTWRDESGHKQEHVTHWRPLPAAPNQNQKEPQ